MPGKYSHSVVLADYSSRGIISLPPDQYSKYIESLPLKQKPSVPQLRLRGTRSAHAIYHDSPVRKPGRPSPVDQQYLTPGNPTGPTRHQLDVITDDNNSKEFNPMRYSRYYEQSPKSCPVVNLVVQTSEPALRTAYQRQQHGNPNIEPRPVNSRPGAQAKVQRMGQAPEERLRSPVIRNSSSHTSLRKHAEPAVAVAVAKATSQSSASNKASSKSTHAATTRAALNTQTSHRFSPPGQDRSYVPAFRENIDSSLTALSQNRSKVKQTSEHAPNRTVSSESRSTLRIRPQESRNSQYQGPRTPVLLEPNFDGFSDVSPSDQFDGHRDAAIHSRDSSLNSVFPIQRPLSPDRPSSRGQHSHSTATPLPKASSAQIGDRNTPSRMTESSVQTSTRAHRSNSSVSSVSVSNGYSYLGTSKHSPEVPRKNSHSSPADQSWRLPEISEDHGFSPSIFEDNEGHQDKMRYDEIDLGTTMGQISSGKDVRFDNSDAMSELSAALPPPITRFRDEEDEFNANMTRLFGEGGDLAVTKKGSHTIGRSATKKTMGFFSKFRSKNQPPDK